MAAVIVDLADAVVAALNGATLSQRFTAERAYVPVLDAGDIAGLRVTVVMRELSLVMLSRRDDDFSYTIDVGIQARVGGGSLTPAEIREATDPYAMLAQEVLDLFRGKPLAVGPDSLSLTCMAAANAPIYHPLHLDEHRVFTSVVSLTFRQARAR